MGSGHFLVNIAINLANFITDFLNSIGIEVEIDSSTKFWRRTVIENCIYGVDINPLALELAKLSLWMLSVTKERPLSFLNHHIRMGDSLAGAWFKNIGVFPRKTKESKEAFTLPLEHFELQINNILDYFRLIKEKSSESIDGILEKSRIYNEDIYPILYHYILLFHLHTYAYFNKDLDESDYINIGRSFNHHDGVEIEENYTFTANWFHWELEFPEIFFNDDPGFDIVIGNPPYASIPSQYTNIFLSDNYIGYKCNDLYGLFLERAIQLGKRDTSYIGFIIPLSISFSNKLKSLRNYLIRQNKTFEIFSFDKRPQSLFKDVQQRTSILFGSPPKSIKKIKSGPITRWTPDERQDLFKNLEVYDSTDLILDIGIPKLGSKLQSEALSHLFISNDKVGNYLLTPKEIRNLTNDEIATNKVHFFGVAYRWLVFARMLPPTKTKNGESVNLSGFNDLYFKDSKIAWQYMAVLNSSYMYWFWLLYGDSFHVTKQVIGSFPIGLENLSNDVQRKIEDLGKVLQTEMLKTVYYNKMMGKIQANFNLLECKTITEKIDIIIGKELGLTKEMIMDIQEFCHSASGI